MGRRSFLVVGGLDQDRNHGDHKDPDNEHAEAQGDPVRDGRVKLAALRALVCLRSERPGATFTGSVFHHHFSLSASSAIKRTAVMYAL